MSAQQTSAVQLIEGAELQPIIKHGVRIGRTDPSDEEKGGWWDVRFHQGEIYALAHYGTEWGVSFGQRIAFSELSGYCDDPNQAARHVQQLRIAAEMGLQVPAPSSTGSHQ